MVNQLHHITLLNGNTALHRLDTLEPDAVEVCRELLPSGGGVPGLPAFRVEIVGPPPLFTVFRGREPILSCAIGEGQNAGAWDELCGLQSGFHPVAASRPERGHWLAVALLPSIQNLTESDIAWLADLERCLAAAIINQE